jgi:predicted RNase H-like HicB family nuclease
MNKYTVVVHRVGSHYVAVCLELNVVRQGATFEKVRRNIVEAIKERLASMHDRNLPDVLRPIPFDLLREFLPDAGLSRVACAGYPFSRN